MLLLPIETLTRELDYKLILGVLHTPKSGGCLVGRHDVLLRITAALSSGAYVGKNIFSVPSNMRDDVRRYQQLKGRGFVLLYLDEEGAVFHANQTLGEVLDSRLDAGLLHDDDAILTWGRQQAVRFSGATPDQGACVSHGSAAVRPRQAR